MKITHKIYVNLLSIIYVFDDMIGYIQNIEDGMAEKDPKVCFLFTFLPPLNSINKKSNL